MVVYIHETMSCWLEPDPEALGCFRPGGVIIGGIVSVKPCFESTPDVHLSLVAALPYESARFGERVTSSKVHSETQNTQTVQIHASSYKSQEFEVMKYRHAVASHPGILPFVLSHQLSATNKRASL